MLLAIFTYGQVASIADLEAISYHETTDDNNAPVKVYSEITYLQTIRKLLRANGEYQLPIGLKNVPKTVYWADRLRAKNPYPQTFRIEKNNTVASLSPLKKMNRFDPLKRKVTANWQPNFSVDLPFGIQQVNRTIYLTDRVEAHYAAFLKKEAASKRNEASEKIVVDRIEKEVDAVNATTSAATDRGSIISKKELKAIVRRAKGKKAKYTTEEFEKETIIKSTQKKPSSISEKLVETKIASTLHNSSDNHSSHEKSVSTPKYETEVVNRELAVLEKMMRDDNQSNARSTSTSSNVNIPVTSQPLEVTSEIINGESVITEIKPVETASPIATTNKITAKPYATAGEERTIKAEHFALNTIENESVNMSHLKGKVVVLNFWFISCVECIREIPHLNELKKRYQGQEIEFVGVCLNDKNKIENFLQKHPFEWKQIPNARQVAHDYYMFIYPGHAVVDKNGGIITLLNGNAPGVLQQLETAIQVGLGETY